MLVQAYDGTGSMPYHPVMLLALLIYGYGYATARFSSRKIERATYGWPYYVCSQGNTVENCVSSRKQSLFAFLAENSLFFCNKSPSKGLRRWRRSLSQTG